MSTGSEDIGDSGRLRHYSAGHEIGWTVGSTLRESRADFGSLVRDVQGRTSATKSNKPNEDAQQLVLKDQEHVGKIGLVPGSSGQIHEDYLESVLRDAILQSKKDRQGKEKYHDSALRPNEPYDEGYSPIGGGDGSTPAPTESAALLSPQPVDIGQIITGEPARLIIRIVVSMVVLGFAGFAASTPGGLSVGAGLFGMVAGYWLR